MILGVTGHRNVSLGGYELPNPIYNYVCQQTEARLKDLQPDKVITGMALGFDSWVANICIKLDIKFIAAVPFINQEIKWPEQSQKIYHKLLSKTNEVVIVSDGGYAAYKLQKRNEWIVDHSDMMLACWNGEQSGGTYNCIEYARSKNKDILIISPNEAHT